MPKPDPPLNYRWPQGEPFPAFVLVAMTIAIVSLVAEALIALTALGPFASFREPLRPIFGGGFLLGILSVGASLGSLRYRDPNTRQSLRSLLWLGLAFSVTALAIAVLTMIFGRD